MGAGPAGLSCAYFLARLGYRPTVLDGLTNNARISQEEIFGPVLVILPYDNDDDAIRIANDSPYGLSGSVWGTDPDRVAHVVAGVRTGTLSVNGGVWYSA